MAKEKRERQSEKQVESKAAVSIHSAKETPRLKSRFQAEVAPALMKEFDLKNPMAVPHINKIVVNMGIGEATQNAKVLDPAVNELGQITGQKPITTKAKKSIAAFKVREGQAIGAMVKARTIGVAQHEARKGEEHVDAELQVGERASVLERMVNRDMKQHHQHRADAPDRVQCFKTTRNRSGLSRHATSPLQAGALREC